MRVLRFRDRDSGHRGLRFFDQKLGRLYAVDFTVLCGVDLVTEPFKYVGNATLEVHRVEGLVPGEVTVKARIWP